MQSLPKGLKFLRVVPTLESPKVMGLVGIHDPDTLQYFASFTYCPWCEKEGQNEGTDGQPPKDHTLQVRPGV